MIQLFDLEGGILKPTIHCYTLNFLKDIIEEYPDDHVSIFSYLFYMSCPSPTLNPFFDVPESEKEMMICDQLNLHVSLEDDLIVEALKQCKLMYETPTQRAYYGIKNMLDKLADYMSTNDITDGRDGNITALVNVAAKFEQVRQSFKGAYKDLMEEQKSTIRGNQKRAYDTN